MSDAVLEAEFRLKDYISGQMKVIQNNMKDFSNSGKTALANVNSASKESATSLGGLGSAIGNMKGAFIAATPIIAGLGLFKLAKDAADVGANFFDMSKRVKLGTEFLSAFDFIAKQSGTSIEALEPSFKKFTINAYESAKGTENAVTAFKALGMVVDSNTLKEKSNSDILKETLLRLSEVKNETEQVALAQQLFGRAGTALLPILDLGAQGIEEQMKKAKELGIVWTEEAAAGADTFGDSLDSLMVQLTGLMRQVLIPMMEPLHTLINAFSALVSGADLVGSAISIAFTNAGKTLSTFFTKGYDEAMKVSLGTPEQKQILSQKTKAFTDATNTWLENNPLFVPVKPVTSGSGETDVEGTGKEAKEIALMEEGEKARQEIYKLRVQNMAEGSAKEIELAEIARNEQLAIYKDLYQRKAIDEQDALNAVQAINDQFKVKKDSIVQKELEDNEKLYMLKLQQEEDFLDAQDESRKQASDRAIELAKNEAMIRQQLSTSVTNNLLAAGTAIASMGKKNAVALKALAMGEIIINTARSITGALATPPVGPWNIAQAVSFGIMGAAQLAKVASTKFAKGGDVYGPSHSMGGVNAELEGGEVVIDKYTSRKNGGFTGIKNTLNGGSGNVIDARSTISITIQGNASDDTILKTRQTLDESYNEFLIKLERAQKDMVYRGISI